MLVRTLQHVEDMSFDTLMAGVPWAEFETFPEYLDAVERRGVDPQLRLLCRPYRGPPLHHGPRGLRTGRHRRRAGRHGRSGGRSPGRRSHRLRHQLVADPQRGPRPTGAVAGGRFRRAGRPARAPAPAQPGRGRPPARRACCPTTRCSSLQRHIGRPFTWTALLTFAGSDYHREVMAEHAAARASGVDVWPQVSCRPLVFQMNLAEPFSLNTFPNFAALMDAPIAERKAAYRDPAWRDATQQQLTSGGFSLFNTASLSVAESPTRPDLEGRRVVELADEQGVTAARRAPRSFVGRRPHHPLLVGAGQRQPGGHRLVAAEGRRAAGPGRFRRPREPAVRRLLRHRPVWATGSGTARS